ncbi:hypothetical protein TWF225_011204 [Orbilia oligospora]|uniref:DUF1279 domain-containing protein n=1 Tax=Orbilia oligospora TaxID=2813651 RepID=A0A7C8K2T2_ORBOL|nr:hypothetical protein TWF751_000549 [Orbilia oligospora]KAF3169991.1 hypothetical protein TWF225_011204 [Orbilia oligospora]KAF3248208.1 hypothetical protein TWF217_009180 [Orbilia oligospora]KAF3250412.1 hypothetical protein TWF128_007558 [Orbilia oligospora]KAF3250413.1 hypothetical protein TWF128_007558 [Orbilia oligospora]
MAVARPAARAALKRAIIPPTFFTSPAARRTNFINPRYFTHSNPLKPTSSSPFSSVLSTLRKSKPSISSARQFSTSSRRPLASRYFSSSATANGNGHSQTVGERMRALFKEYGMSAVGVYFLLSVLDFPFCFLFVKMVGTEKIAHYEHIIIDGFWNVMPETIRQFRPAAIKEAKVEADRVAVGIGGDIDALAHGEGVMGQGAVKNSNGGEASIWTVLILAYAVHKSLIFFRVPLAAAVTPKIVQKLRGWGFNIGKKGGVRQGVKDARANLKERRSKKGKRKNDDDDD